LTLEVLAVNGRKEDRSSIHHREDATVISKHIHKPGPSKLIDGSEIYGNASISSTHIEKNIYIFNNIKELDYKLRI